MKKKNIKKSSLSILSIAGVNSYKKKKNEKYMNSKQINHFTIILETWKKQLNKNKINIYDISKKSSNFPDPIDRAVQEEEFNLELRNRERENTLIKKINITLKKIQEKEFGYCSFCGVEIGIKRLEARPTADLCIDCKTLEEIREKQILI
ncbi:MAG: RNA polymerase-binding protein DksA [Buchnera aphidicola (Periphyllus lyropictus)]|uniref:RNA polymerase-binding protein DksA n=1 Tax=Buchnera aphidicola TaxID=9 RepID=UPI001EB2FABC|nr:RNA polymerase-binding protein DksA [Buchnera aphidicola]NIH16655.1 RNA polymerase-binding protein DksA [Buchnera aphidicola (Periphyllus lyropictus)]USS94565.1 RNA polymerase-binding protein DksA [Buchnera aphidicola (Periphyllus lyropictus)]